MRENQYEILIDFKEAKVRDFIIKKIVKKKKAMRNYCNSDDRHYYVEYFPSPFS